VDMITNLIFERSADFILLVYRMNTVYEGMGVMTFVKYVSEKLVK